MDKIPLLEDIPVLSDEIKSTKAHNRAVALKFLQGADRRLYGVFWVHLQNNFSLGVNQYPSDLTEVYTMSLNYVPPRVDQH